MIDQLESFGMLLFQVITIDSALDLQMREVNRNSHEMKQSNLLEGYCDFARKLVLLDLVLDDSFVTCLLIDS